MIDRQAERVGRLIPACAGKTGPTPGRNSPSRAHPRVCGENHALLVNDPNSLGSSPRGRGKRQHPRRGGAAGGLIPACAGKTRSGGSLPGGRPAHPRVCGENVALSHDAVYSTGSSPRVRGKHSGEVTQQPRVRLIPACAGKTARGRRTPSSCRAHPRVCGENPRSRGYARSSDGSSPRVRGKRRAPGSGGDPPRLIPACAGKTAQPRIEPRRFQAHPRVCGENDQINNGTAPRPGSSPRVRGKPVQRHAAREDCRLIPACAGKTPATRTVWRGPKAHPRVCGENTS